MSILGKIFGSSQLAAQQSQAGSAGLQAQLGTPQNVLIGGAGNGGLVTTTSTWFAGQPTTPLTKEENAELEELRKEHEIKIKAAKLSEFKKLPTDLRQFVLNFYSWTESVAKIDSIDEQKQQRLIDLEYKDQMSKLYGSFGGINGGFVYGGMGGSWTTNASINVPFILAMPKGITSEDLKQAHLEACLEEEMLEQV